jgi:hypothetical protein
VAGGALPMSAGSSFQGRKKPNGSACHRRTMAGLQGEAKHATKARNSECAPAPPATSLKVTAP